VGKWAELGEDQLPLVECFGGPLDGKRVPNKGPRIELVLEPGHEYRLGIRGELSDPTNPRRVCYIYEYPGGPL